MWRCGGPPPGSAPGADIRTRFSDFAVCAAGKLASGLNCAVLKEPGVSAFSGCSPDAARREGPAGSVTHVLVPAFGHGVSESSLM